MLLIAILGATAGVSYGLSLAMLGDKFSGATLVVANAVFGVFYAIASILGPLLHGLFMEILGPQGLTWSITLIFSALILAFYVLGSEKIWGRS